MRFLTALLITGGVLGGLALARTSAAEEPKPHPNPLPDIDPNPKPKPNESRDIARADELLRKARANDSDPTLDPDEMFNLAVRLQTVSPERSAELAGYAQLIKVRRGQAPLPFPVKGKELDDNMLGDEGDTRPAPGVLPTDLAARVAYLLNPEFKPTLEQVTDVIRELNAYRGFDGEKMSLRRLRQSLAAGA